MRDFRVYAKSLAICLTLIIGLTINASAQSTEFSYQGFLSDTSASANGNFDFEFRLFSAASGGTLEGTNQRLNVQVTNGVFSVTLDFGAGAFPGADRFLEIMVKPAGGGSFTTLAPRQRIGRAPYAISSGSADQAAFAINANNAQNALNAVTAANATTATTANNALQLGGVAASQFVQTTDGRLADARNPLPDSPNYIQNTPALKLGSFNITGSGTVVGTLSGNIVNATTQFNIDGLRVLTSPGSFNFFAGNGAGQSNTTGTRNSFFGVNAGVVNTTGGSNAYFGFEAGRNNSAGTRNSFFGRDAGRSNTTGNDNSFFGFEAGQSNLTASSNAFFGTNSGRVNTTGNENAFFGFDSGKLNTTGNENTFFGKGTGTTNTTGDGNTLIGFNANVATSIQVNAGAFGNKAFVENSNAIVIGSVNGKNGATSDVSVGIGITNPVVPLEIEGELDRPNIRVTNWGRYSVFSGRSSEGTRNNPTASLADRPMFIIGGDGHTGSALTVNSAAMIQFSTYENWTPTANGTSISFFTTLNGSTNKFERMRIEDDGDVGIGTIAPARKLDVNGNVRIGGLTSATGCVEDRDGTVIAGTCSSDLRFKKDITSFGNILNSFSKLRPVNYYWRTDEFPERYFGTKQSYGLIAQDVEAIFPELIATDEQGFKAINYSKLPLYTIQAVKELKTENDAMRQMIADQKAQLELQRAAIEKLQAFVYRPRTARAAKPRAAKRR